MGGCPCVERFFSLSLATLSELAQNNLVLMAKSHAWERLERGFVLDGVATSWARLPPYNPQLDPAVATYFTNRGVNSVLRRTKQWRGGTSQMGWLHDHEYASTIGAKYIRERTRQYRGGHAKHLVAGHMSITPQIRTPTPKASLYAMRDGSRWQIEDPNIME